MDPITELAKMFKERDNKSYLGAQTGIITRLYPLEVRLNENILLNSSHLKQSRTFSNGLKEIGYKVILIPSGDMQQFYIIDVEV
ncbi:hypothetical protein [Jeotgalibacillus terrae]|uniref:DUF2577 domain-containing protein n=1 Tax=Jeotgalibacillus terrae TaxID=587735 RepID=A0ABW5ZGY7_9BACL|nr:hypothetical protein [Jeotgalibacillus terrae]MBM7577663.1 hypothetical protein [Jeotgalibacillus terrae]